MKKAKIETDEFIKLKEKGMSDKDIAAYYTKQGIEIKENTVSQRLYRYYKSRGQKRPNVPKAEIDISKEELEEIVELNDKGMSYSKISLYYAEKNKFISPATIGKKLLKYYASQGKKNPKVQLILKSPIEISQKEMQEMVKLKEDGMTDKGIAKHFIQKGKNISYTTVGKKLSEYYDNQGKEKPKADPFLKKTTIEISKKEIQEMVELKEKGMSYIDIAKHFTQKGKSISPSTVRKRLLEYYNEQGKAQPIYESIEISKKEMQEMVELKEKGMTDLDIAKYFTQKGKSMSSGMVGDRLTEYYKIHGKQKPRRERIYEDSLKEILMTGMSIEEFVTEFKEDDDKESIKEELKKLRVIAECSKKENGEFVADNNFLEVIDVIEGYSEKIKWYEGNTDRYITEGKCRKGNIDLIREKVFNENTDLMVYALSRMNVTYQPGYDMRVYNIMKSEYEEKIDKYLERLHCIEDNRKNSKLNSEKSNNLNLQDEER